MQWGRRPPPPSFSCPAMRESQPRASITRPPQPFHSSARYSDASNASIVLWVETSRIPCAQGCGPPGGAAVCNSASEVTTLRRYKNPFITVIIIIINFNR